MRFAEWVFLLAGITGILQVIPPYFLEEQFGRDHPPPVNHPEFYYGFFGVTLSWQVMFLVIGTDSISEGHDSVHLGKSKFCRCNPYSLRPGASSCHLGGLRLDRRNVVSIVPGGLLANSPQMPQD
jgi:hypothetical protein